MLIRGRLGAEERVEDLPLGGVRILGFVDQTGLVVLLEETT